MCGIAGFAGERDLEKSHFRVKKMTESIAHRGPDASGYFVKDKVALGHRRLSIIDLSTAAHQPITDPTGRYTIIYNGEVYNFQEVKKDLSEFTFQSNSDTDIILAAYIKWGPESLNRLNGMFAFAIWDAEDESLFIARDRLGIKPLYYHFDGQRLIFASEIRALLDSEYVPRKLNRAALNEYLRYYSVNAPNTLIQEVKMLMPGAYGLWEGGEFSTQIYWSLADERPEIQEDYEKVCRQTKTLLSEAVERRMMSDVPFGAFLSGGIDSSAIVALMASVSEQPIHTFSVVFDEKEYDESVYSAMIANKYKTEHHPISLNPNDFLKELPQALSSMDHPSGDGLNSYVVSQVTKQTGFTVALSGLGGDELFAGYPVFKRYEKLKKLPLFYDVPAGIRAALGKTVSTVYNNHKTARLQELMTVQDNDFSKLYPVFRKIMEDQEIDQLLGSHTSPEIFLQQMFSQDALARINQLPLFSQVSVGEISTYTQHVLLRDTDQMSMAHSLEVRVPFFDHELVEYVLGIPDAQKNPTYPKKLLVDAMGDLLPKEVVFRKKMGFMFPWDQWIRNDLKNLCDQHFQSLGQRGIFDPVALQKIWQGFLTGNKRITWIKVWMLVVLESWLSKQGIDG